MLALKLFWPAPAHNLPWIIIVYQCWKKWLQSHFTHQHKGESKAPMECLSHPLESLNYIHHGPLLPVSSPSRGKGRARCLLLASLTRPRRLVSPFRYPRLILQLKRGCKKSLKGPDGTEGSFFCSQLLCIQGQTGDLGMSLTPVQKPCGVRRNRYQPGATTVARNSTSTDICWLKTNHLAWGGGWVDRIPVT